jgi:hypothetical protein
MANTYKVIASSTIGSGSISSVTFDNIPQTYDNLLLKISARTANASVVDGILIDINNITSGSYDYKRLIGNGASVTNAGALGNTQMYINFAANGSTSTSSTFGNIDVYFTNYKNTSFYKTVMCDVCVENNATTAYLGTQAHSLNGTAAITKLYIYNGGNTTFAQYSTFVLYGIKNS